MCVKQANKPKRVIKVDGSGIGKCINAGCIIAIKLFYAPNYLTEWGTGPQYYKMEDNHVSQNN